MKEGKMLVYMLPAKKEKEKVVRIPETQQSSEEGKVFAEKNWRRKRKKKNTPAFTSIIRSS